MKNWTRLRFLCSSLRRHQNCGLCYFLRKATRHNGIDFAPILNAENSLRWFAGDLLKRLGEFVERGAADRSAEQCLQLGSVGDRLNLLAQPRWDSIKSDFQCFEDVLLLG